MSEENQIKNEEIEENTVPRRPKSHRIVAWIAIILLLAMYTVTLIAALSGSGTTSALFMMSLGATVVIPGLLWGYIVFWKASMERDRKTFKEEIDQKKSS